MRDRSRAAPWTRLAVFLAVWLACGAARSAGTSVLVPDRDNLQFVAFWVAKGAGYFDDEGVPVEVLVPPAPGMTVTWFKERKAQIAVLPPPMYLDLIAAREPIVLTTNLLRHDPIMLVAKRSFVDARKVPLGAPLPQRLASIRGARVGVASHPIARLRALMSSEGLDADRDLVIVTLHGTEQNAAFHEGRVDALFAHTPYLERAIVDDDAVVVFDGPRGESAVLRVPQVHALAFLRSFRESSPAFAQGMTRAITRAQKTLRQEPARAVAAILRELPQLERRHVEKLVQLYGPAMPETAEVSEAGVRAWLPLFPAGRAPPNLDGVAVSAHVDPELGRAAAAALAGNTSRRWAVFVAIALATIGIAIFTVRRRRRGRTAS